ncbi:MAG: hypothetical protein VYC39_06040, partial [Myxococcota bacterium]|nr:hypothetical protein [Myxococcota bacterium]
AATRYRQDSGKKSSVFLILFSICTAFCVFLAPPALAKPSTSGGTPKDVVSSLNVAKNAFEYRDFQKVIDILDPWVHPPRISDPKLMGQARRLLGISYHLVGNQKQAAEEFAQLLLLEPDVKLDPFVVPPAVIQTFDEVRQTLIRPVEKPIKGPEQQIPSNLVQVIAHPSVSFLPFSYAQLAIIEGQKAWGWTWLATQLVGVALNIGGYWAASSLREANGVPASQQSRFETYVIGMYTGAGLFSAGYLGSSIQAYRELSNRTEDRQSIQTIDSGTSGSIDSRFSIPVWRSGW